tara:strand:- start:84 stop:497 length:414 start_codon:yes stop_codon:yes gene_type:complete
LHIFDALFPGNSARSGSARIGGTVREEPYQRCFCIVKQTLPGSCRSSGARNEHIVMPGLRVSRQKRARDLSQAAPGAIADYGIADLARRCEAFSDMIGTVTSVDNLHDNKMAPQKATFRSAQKFAPYSETADVDRSA